MLRDLTNVNTLKDIYIHVQILILNRSIKPLIEFATIANNFKLK